MPPHPKPVRRALTTALAKFRSADRTTLWLLLIVVIIAVVDVFRGDFLAW